MAGAIAVLGIGAITYNENQNNVNRLNDEDAKLKTLIDNLTTRMAAVETTANGAATSSSLTSLTTKVTNNCAERATIAALTDPTDSATTQAGVIAIIAAAKVNPC